HVDGLLHELRGQCAEPLLPVLGVAHVEDRALSVDVAELVQPLAERLQHGGARRWRVGEEYADAHRPGGRRRGDRRYRARQRAPEQQRDQASAEGARTFDHSTHSPSRATTRPPLTTQIRGGRATTASASVSPGTTTKLARQPTSRP